MHPLSVKKIFKFYGQGLKKISLLSLIIGFCFIKSYAQDISMEQTLTYINSKLGGNIVLDIAHGNIVATYSENGNEYREDQVYIGDLDSNAIKYINSDNLFVINCKSTKKKCVTRNLFVLKETKTYGRISFPIMLNEKSANGLIKAFKHMIRLVMVKKYESSEPFE